jgi:tetrahydromethanopterin S-methyltransferase subunit C
MEEIMAVNTGAYEGRTTSSVDRATGRVPSMAYLGLAVGAMAASAALVLSGRKQLGNFVGQWAPSILIVGLYNKLLKVASTPPMVRATA